MIDTGLPAILALWQAAALLVLLIACTNIANLLLARGVEQQRDLAVRAAIGASRWRLLRQLLAESLALAIASTPVALGVASLGLTALKAAMPPPLIRFVSGWTELGVDGRLVAFTLVVAVGTVVLFGVLPAWQLSRVDLMGSLREGGRSGTAGPWRSRLRRSLVVAQIALALPLLVASGLAAIATSRFVNGPQGYDPAGVMSLRMVLPVANYATADARRQFIERLLTEVSHVPAVDATGTSSTLPASSMTQSRQLTIDGRAEDRDHPISVYYRAVTPQYFDALRIPVRTGRAFGDPDRADTQPVAIVSQSLATRYWPNAESLGRRVHLEGSKADWTTVIGIVGNTIDDWFVSRNAPTIYVPEAQAPSASVYLVARTPADPVSLGRPLQAAIAAVDSQVPAFEVMSMRDRLRQRTSGLQFVGALMAVFGLLALVLAAGGLYAVMAFFVSQRRHEIGVRMALGATATNVLRQIAGHAWRLSIIGIAIGLGLAVLLAKAMERALFGIVAAEPGLFVGVVIVLLVAAAAASWLPTRRATRIDPALALRTE
jgi:putative ABC transport system permease protein